MQNLFTFKGFCKQKTLKKNTKGVKSYTLCAVPYREEPGVNFYNPCGSLPIQDIL